MVAKFSVILAFICCTFALATAATIYDDGVYLPQSVASLELETLSRHARSPKDGSVQVDVKKDAGGRSAGVEYQQNLYRGDKGRFSVDAYGRAEKNFDTRRHDYGGGIRGSWKF